MDNGAPSFPSSRFLGVACVIVPKGSPPPLEWMAAHPDYVTVRGVIIPRAPLELDMELEPRPESEGQAEPLPEKPTFRVEIDYAGNWIIKGVTVMMPRPAPRTDPPSARPQDPEPGQSQRPPTPADPPPGPMLDPQPRETGPRPDHLRFVAPPGPRRARGGPPPLGPNPAATGMAPLSPEFTRNLVRKTARIIAGMDRVMRPGGIATDEALSAAVRAGMQHLAAHQGDVHAALASAKAARSGHGSKPAADHTDFAVAASATANGAKSLSEVAAGLEAAAGVAETAGIGVTAAMLLEPIPAGAGEEQALRAYRAGHAGTDEAHGFEPPPPSPPLPGLVPPPLPQTKPGAGGFTPTPPTPPLPGFTPSPPSVPVHPGRQVEANKPLIVESRKGGISSGATSELASVLAPGGQVVGTVHPGAGQDIKTVTPNEFDILKAKLLQNAQPISDPSSYKGYKGTVYVLPDGEVFGLRTSALNGETIDVFASKTNLIPKGFKVHQK